MPLRALVVFLRISGSVTIMSTRAYGFNALTGFGCISTRVGTYHTKAQAVLMPLRALVVFLPDVEPLPYGALEEF